MDLAALAATFLVVLAVELPDKTLMATLVLSSRYRAAPVLLGVSAAFVVQSLIAVLAGSVITLLPRAVVLGVVAVLFLLGAVLLVRESLRPAEVDGDASSGRQAGVSFLRAAVTSFGVLFAAEWGDASQLATAAMAARYQAAVAVFVGATAALVGIAALAVFVGRTVLKYVPLHLIQRVAAAMFAGFAVWALVELVRAL